MFVKEFSRIAKSLTELTENVRFMWNNDASEALEKLKKHVYSAPILRLSDPQRYFCITTDLSRLIIGAVMEQEFENGPQYVCFASKTLNPAQQNYAAHDLELIGIVQNLKAWVFIFTGENSWFT